MTWQTGWMNDTSMCWTRRCVAEWMRWIGSLSSCPCIQPDQSGLLPKHTHEHDGPARPSAMQPTTQPKKKHDKQPARLNNLLLLVVKDDRAMWTRHHGILGWPMPVRQRSLLSTRGSASEPAAQGGISTPLQGIPTESMHDTLLDRSTPEWTKRRKQSRIQQR